MIAGFAFGVASAVYVFALYALQTARKEIAASMLERDTHRAQIESLTQQVMDLEIRVPR